MFGFLAGANPKTPLYVNTYITSYNPEAGQTDSTPCVAGGTQMDLCDMAKQGLRPIALSQDHAKWSNYADSDALEAGTNIWLESTDYPDDPRCNGLFIVADAMNARYTNRADLFFMNRSDNISCHANIYKFGKCRDTASIFLWKFIQIP